MYTLGAGIAQVVECQTGIPIIQGLSPGRGGGGDEGDFP